MGTLLNCRDLVRNVAGMTPGFGWIQLASFFGFTNLNVRVQFSASVVGTSGGHPNPNGSLTFDQNANLSRAMAAVVDSDFELNQEDYWNSFPNLVAQQGLFQAGAVTDGTDSEDVGLDLYLDSYGVGRYGPNNLDLGLSAYSQGVFIWPHSLPPPGLNDGTPINIVLLLADTSDIFNNIVFSPSNVARVITDLNDFTSPIVINRQTTTPIAGTFSSYGFDLSYNITYTLTFS